MTSVFSWQNSVSLCPASFHIPRVKLPVTLGTSWLPTFSFQFSSVQFSPSVVSDSLRPHELQHTRPPCPSPTPGVHSDSCPSSQWCHPDISSSVVPFSSCPQSLPASEFENNSSLVLSLLYSPTLTFIHNYWKNYSLTLQTFVGKVMSLLFNTLGLSQFLF